VGKDRNVAGVAIITEACIDVKDRACVDVCPVQCIYEFDPVKNQLFSEAEAGSGEIETTHAPRPESIAVFSDSILYVNTEECTSCTACYQPDVCPVGAIYSEEVVPDGKLRTHYNAEDPNKGHDHTFFIQLSRDVFAD
jgi:NAD-dependent dihydropyrimidine dehydrogenase PreA subunit